MKTGIVFKIEELTLHDGQGARLTVFLKGCPLNCVWCHNPEGKNPEPQLLYYSEKCCHCNLCKTLTDHSSFEKYGRNVKVCPNNCLRMCGKEYTSEELANKINSFKRIFDKCGGGVTFSGGEPLFQHEFLLEVIEKLDGINVDIETSGYASEDVFRSIVTKANHVYMDIKLIDDDKHIKYVGKSNKIIINNFNVLNNLGIPYTIRTPLISGIVDTKENLEKIKDLIGNSKWELLPENKLARAKDHLLNI